MGASIYDVATYQIPALSTLRGGGIMSEVTVVEANVEAFDTVTLDPEGRVEYEDGHLTALHEADADTETFRVALFPYESEPTVELPEGAVVLDAGQGVVTALVPETAYHGGGGA